MPRKARPGSHYYLPQDVDGYDSDDEGGRESRGVDSQMESRGCDEATNLQLMDLTATVAELKSEIQEIRDYMPLLRDLPMIIPLLRSVHEKVVIGTRGKDIAVRKATPNKIKTKRLVKEIEKSEPCMESCRDLLEQGADPDGDFDVCLYTPLHSASRRNLKDIVMLLMNHHANVDKLSCSESALWVAAMEGNATIVQMLINANAEFDKAAEKKETCQCTTPLHMACQGSYGDIVRILLVAGANPNKQVHKNAVGETFKVTPLAMACRNDSFEIAEMLMEYGATLEGITYAEARNDHWPLSSACKRGNAQLVDLLMQHSAMEGIPEWNIMLWHLFAICTRSGHADTLNMVLEPIKAKMRDEFHHGFTCDGCIEEEQHEYIFGRRYQCMTCPSFNLCHACMEKGVHTEHYKMIKTGAFDQNWILERTVDGEKLIHIACQKNHIDIVNILIDFGVRTNETYPRNKLPITVASQHGHLDIVRLLLITKTAWFDEDATNMENNGANAVNESIKNQHWEVLENLLEYKCKVNNGVLYNAFNMRPVDIDIVKRLLAAGSNPNETSELLKWEPFESLSPLHVACLEGNLVLVQMLLDSDAYIFKVDKDGNTGLHFACMMGHIDVARLLISVKKSKILNIQNNNNEAAVHLAAKYGRKDVVGLLMEHKAILGGGVSSLSYACQGLGLLESQAYVDIAIMLIDGRDDWDKLDQYGARPLSYALGYGSKTLVRKLLDVRCEVDEAKQRPQIKELMEDNKMKKTVHVFKPRDEMVKQQNRFLVTYSSIEDKYFNNTEYESRGWETAVENFTNIFRNVDDDNEKVYLSRTEGSAMASISWKFSHFGKELLIESFKMKMDVVTKTSGRISLQVIGWDGDKRKYVENVSMKPKASDIQFLDEGKFNGLSGITVIAHLIGGEGEQAWQHTQLFRRDSSMNSLESQHPFIVDIKLRSKYEKKNETEDVDPEVQRIMQMINGK